MGLERVHCLFLFINLHRTWTVVLRLLLMWLIKDVNITYGNNTS